VKVKRIELENFISYERLSIELPPDGSIVFIGRNGAGKSSILDAVPFALFKVNPRGGNFADLVRRGANRTRVAVEFAISSKLFRVERTLRIFKGGRTESSATLYVKTNGGFKAIASGNEVTKVIEELLGLSDKLFLSAVYAKQGEIAKLVELRPADRDKLINYLLGIEDLQLAYERIREVISHFKSLSEKLRGELSQKMELVNSIERKRHELSEKKNSIVRIEKKLNEVSEEISKLEKTKKAFEEKIALLQRLEAEKRALEGKREQLEKTARTLEEQLKAAEEAEHRLPELLSLIEKLEPLKNFEAIERERSLIADNLKNVLKELKRAEELSSKVKQLEEYSNKLRTLNEELEKAEEKRRKLLEEKAKVQRDKELYEKIIEEKRELEEKLAILYSQAVSALGEEYVVEKLPEKLQKVKEKLEEEIHHLRNRKSKLEKNIDTWRALLHERQTSLEKLDKAAGKCPVCESPLSEEKKEKLKADFAAQISELENRLNEAERELSDLSASLKEKETALSRINAVNISELRFLLQRRSEIEASLNKLAEQAKKLEKIEEELLSAEAKTQRLKKEKADFEALVKLAEEALKELEKIEIDTLKNRRKELEAKLNELEARLKFLEALAQKHGGLSQALNLLSQLEKERDKLSATILQRERIEKQLSKYKDELNELKNGIKKIDSEIRKIGVTPEILREVEALLAEKQREVGVLKGQLREVFKSISSLEAELEELEHKLQSLKKKEEQLNKTRKIISLLENIRQAYGREGAQKLLRKKAKPVIEEYLQSFASLFELEFLNLKLDEHYSLQIVDANGTRPVSVASGGEKAALGLAFRLALAKAIGGDRLKFMMLDEPTQNLDEERRRGLIKSLKKLFGMHGAAFPQLIVVTHNRELEDAADQVYIVEKVGGKSRVTRVS